MSLLDDVSIVVTPNGYKAGELYAVLPTYAEGSEEITNGDFATDSDWTFGGTSFSAGAILFDSSGDYAFQIWSDTVNTLYKLTITKTGSGTLRFRSGFAGSASTKIDIPESGIVYFTSTSDTNRIQIFGDSGSVNATLNSVSVKEVTSADMDVTRATAATRVDEDGLVNYAEVVSDTELVTNGDFATDSDWTKGSNWTISGGSANSDGTDATSNLYQNTFLSFNGKGFLVEGNASNVTQGFVYISLGGSDLQIVVNSNGAFKHYVNISSGNSILYISGRNNFIGSIDNVSVKQLTRDNVPRIDYTGGGCPHILAEPQRTNLITYSEDFSQSVWADYDVSVLTNQTNSPEGIQNAAKVTENTINAQHLVQYVFSQNASTNYSLSVFIKSNGRDYFGMNIGASRLYANFDLLNGTVTQVNSNGTDFNNESASISSYGNGWYKCILSGYAITSAGGYIRLGIRQTLGTGNSQSYTGDGVSGLYLWGGSLEVGSYPTSYIPTSGSTVTRNQDIFTRDGIGSLINSTEGVLFAEMAAFSNDGTNRKIALSDGTGSNLVRFYFSNSSNRVVAQVKVGGSTQVTFDITGITVTNFNKVALKYKENDFAIWINGVERGTDTSGTTPSSMNKIAFDNGAGSDYFYGKVKQLQVYNTALTDEQLLQLTGTSGTDFYESYAEMASALTYTIQ